MSETNLTDADLLYSATGRCRCGAGLAYPLDHKAALLLSAWCCSDSLKSGGFEPTSGIPAHDAFPFAFYKIREETSINGDGSHEWESEPYVACGLGHHWFSGPCPSCGYSAGSAGTWRTGDGEPIKTRYRTVVLPDNQAGKEEES